MITANQLPELKQHFRKLLQEELCLARFSETKEGDYLFHYECMRLRMCFDSEESAYVWLGRAFYWAQKAQPDDLATVDRCISEVNHRYKVVKLSRNPKPDREGDYAVSASVSFLVENTGKPTAAALERYMNLIKAGGRLFRELHGAAEKEDKRIAMKLEAPAVAVRH
jgi:hypothetical protein